MGLISDLQGYRVYLDANVFIYALTGFPAYAAVLTELFEAIDGGSISAVTSELSIAEALIMPFRHGDVAEENRCRMMLKERPGLTLVPVSIGILEAMARMRAASAAIRTPDAIHAATAVQAGCSVFLTNDRRLRKLPGVQVRLLSDAAAP